MKISKHTLLYVCGLTLGMSATSTLAQVAPPPTKPAQAEPEYTPKEVKPTPAPTKQAEPTKPAKKSTVNAKPSGGKISELPIDVPYPKLAQQGPDGRLLRLRQLPDIAALRSNPNVGPKSAEMIMPIIYSRRYRFEHILIDNLDLYWALTNGMIDNMKLTDLDGMGKIAEMLKPLVGKTTLSQELQNKNILSRVQGGMNQYIVREYKKMITDEIQVLSDDGGLEEVMKFVLHDSLQETRITYEAMLSEIISQIASLVNSTDSDSEAAQALAALEKPLSSDPEQQFIDLMEFDTAFRKIDLEEAMNILSAVRETRKNPDVSPTVAPLNVLHERKQVLEKGFNVEEIRMKGEKVRDKDGKVKKNTPNQDQPSENES